MPRENPVNIELSLSIEELENLISATIEKYYELFGHECLQQFCGYEEIENSDLKDMLMPVKQINQSLLYNTKCVRIILVKGYRGEGMFLKDLKMRDELITIIVNKSMIDDLNSGLTVPAPKQTYRIKTAYIDENLDKYFYDYNKHISLQTFYSGFVEQRNENLYETRKRLE